MLEKIRFGPVFKQLKAGEKKAQHSSNRQEVITPTGV